MRMFEDGAKTKGGADTWVGEDGSWNDGNEEVI